MHCHAAGMLNLLHILICFVSNCHGNPVGLLTVILTVVTKIVESLYYVHVIFQATNPSPVCMLWTELFLLWCGGDVYWSLSGGQTGRSTEKPALYMDKVLQKEETHHSSSCSSPFSGVSSSNGKCLEICLSLNYSRYNLVCEQRRISGCHLVLLKNNVCEPEPENDFCDVGIISQSQFGSNNPRTTAWGIRCEEHLSFNLWWNLIDQGETKVITSQKLFPGLGLQTLFFGRTKWQLEIRLHLQVRYNLESEAHFS